MTAGIGNTIHKFSTQATVQLVCDRSADTCICRANPLAYQFRLDILQPTKTAVPARHLNKLCK